jgi:hypothetical protein
VRHVDGVGAVVQQRDADQRRPVTMLPDVLPSETLKVTDPAGVIALKDEP